METTVKKTESSFTPQFADESELRTTKVIYGGSDDYAGDTITWDDAQCIGKGITIDGVEIFGGEKFAACNFENWTISDEEDKGINILKSNRQAFIDYDFDNVSKLCRVILENKTDSDLQYDECFISKLNVGGRVSEDGGWINKIDYNGIEDEIKSSVELPYDVTWNMTPDEVEKILGTPYSNNTVNLEDSRGSFWIMKYYTSDKNHTIEFWFNPEQSCELCDVYVSYAYYNN